jgi:LysR family hca operon transcriptional activator
VLKSAIDDYAAKVGITLKPKHDADNLSSAMSLVALDPRCDIFSTLHGKYADTGSCRSAVAVRPSYHRFIIGYNKSNASPLLKRFLSRADELAVGLAHKQLPLGTLKYSIT